MKTKSNHTWVMLAFGLIIGTGLVLPGASAFAQETTGENIRVIIEDLHQGMTDLDPQIKFNEAKQDAINTDLDVLREQLLNTDDSELVSGISARMLEGRAGLNGLARTRIDLFKNVISDVLHPSLLKLGGEIENVGALGQRNWSEFESYRNDMEAIMPFIASALLETDRLLTYTSDPEAADRLRDEKADLEHTLLFLHNSLATASEMGEIVAQDIYDQAHALSGVYGKLVVLGQLLDQESNVLRGELVAQTWGAIKPFIDGSDLAVAMNSAESMTEVLQSCTADIKLIRSARMRSEANNSRAEARSNGSTVRQIANGQMDW